MPVVALVDAVVTEPEQRTLVLHGPILGEHGNAGGHGENAGGAEGDDEAVDEVSHVDLRGKRPPGPGTGAGTSDGRQSRRKVPPEPAR